MKPVLLIGHDADESFGVAPEGLGLGGVEILRHYAPQGKPLPPLQEVSGVVMFGGIMNVDMTDRYPFLAEEKAFIRETVDSGVPYLGICLGAQMLARALERTVYPVGVRQLGFNALHLPAEAASDPLLSVFEEGDMVFHWHEDTFELPEGAMVLGTGDAVRLQAFRIGDRAWGTQFHFEVDRQELDHWLLRAGDDVLRAWGSTADELKDGSSKYLPTQERRAREVFRRFGQVCLVGAADPLLHS